MPQTITIPTLELENGVLMHEVPVAYQTWGSLNPQRDNAIIVCHALTGNTDVADWWKGMLGPGLVLDTNRYFIVCANTIGSPYGSVSPLTTNPRTGKPYGAHFPAVTIRDTVSLHRLLLERLGIRQLALAIGGSMGGMQVLEWAFHDDFVRAIIPVAVGGRHSAWCIGWGESQRQAIYADPNWQGGHYTEETSPEQGLAAARMMAMISYRAPKEFSERFGRDEMAPSNGTKAPFAVESYLGYQGKKLVQRFDANCYVQLTKQMDSHDVARGRGSYKSVLSQIKQPALVVGIPSDILYVLSEQEELAELLPTGQLAVLEAPFGHDSFLIEFERLNQLIRPWMEVHVPISILA